MREVLHLNFDSTSETWIGGLQTRVAHSSSPRLRERYQSWASVGLGEFALAITTRLAIIMRVEVRLRECLSALASEIDQWGELEAHLASGRCYRTSNEGLLFDICGAVDSCFFEWKSLYELVQKFATTFAKEILGTKISGSHIDSVVEQAGVPINLIHRLRENRNLFVHQTAPWIAIEIMSRQPLECAILIMKKNLETLDEAEKYITEAELIETSNHLRQSVIAVRIWLEAQVETLEATLNGGASGQMPAECSGPTGR